MKFITETVVRKILKEGISNNLFEIPSGSKLTPAARDYLSDNRVQLKGEGDRKGHIKKNIDLSRDKKPEFMTHLSGNVLVDKDDPRIEFRGRLDSLQAEILRLMLVAQRGKREDLLCHVKEVLDYTREILTAEVLDRPLHEISLFGYDAAELRDRSHNAQKYYNVKVLQLPDIVYGEIYIELNLIRCKVRETELFAVRAFKVQESIFERKDIIQALNRLSSGVHVLMCEEIWNGRHDKQY